MYRLIRPERVQLVDYWWECSVCSTLYRFRKDVVECCKKKAEEVMNPKLQPVKPGDEVLILLDEEEESYERESKGKSCR